MLIIGIAGGTGSGKTTVVRKIVEQLPQGEVAVMAQDSYYRDSGHPALRALMDLRVFVDADLIVPQGGNNKAAIDLLSQFIMRNLSQPH